MIHEIIGFLDNDREMQLQCAGHRHIRPVAEHYRTIELDERLRTIFLNRGIAQFYSHQAEAIDQIRLGRNIVLMTPTASGKSLAYNIPVLEAILADRNTQALCIFPLKGLEQDQVKNLNELSAEVGLGRVGEVYDGDTPATKRQEIRANLPNVIFTNPDMIHLAFLPFHKKWENFFRNLRYIVIDEIHTYRGVFGSHVAQVIRRLRRICEHYGSSPQFISASATIANPGRLAEDLTGLQFSVIDESGAPIAGKHFYFMSPIESPYTLATKLFVQCMKQGMRTIVFTRARKITELIHNWAVNYAPDLRDRISPYRAGFLPAERREIEARLFSGELLGVVSTSALELGVDIGGLDCCILCGYPGSVSSTWQRAGRVGRQGQESLVILVAIQDALDHYFMRHPAEFFSKSHEAAVIDPFNAYIMKKHLLCAAAELNLTLDDPAFDMEAALTLIEELVADHTLVPGKKSGIWFSPLKMPQRDVSIRAAGERFMLVNESGRTIGELGGARVFREAFPGAVYLHRGKQYKVVELDISKKRAVCRSANLAFYTQPVSGDTTQIIAKQETKRFNRLTFDWGRLRIVQKVMGYDTKRVSDNKWISTTPLQLPDHVFETEGLWVVLDREIEREIEARGFDLGGTIHAVEHTAIACMPLFVLCDSGDIGGLSHTSFPDFGLPAIFMYDGHEGGVGLTRRVLDIIPEWLGATLRIIEDCECESGCPSCVQDAQCGNRNEPLDKHGAKWLLRKWLNDREE
ncbi:MAG: DEAD/DEAH box helicase [Nitrospirae bacterium]|nr:DEAD/DEAH box helicase [Nitrospirota bacterium]